MTESTNEDNRNEFSTENPFPEDVKGQNPRKFIRTKIYLEINNLAGER